MYTNKIDSISIENQSFIGFKMTKLKRNNFILQKRNAKYLHSAGG